MPLPIRTLIDTPLALGEAPCWSAGERALYFVDILAPALHRLDVTTGDFRAWRMPEAIGSFGLCPGGQAIVALKSGVYLFDFGTESLRFIVDPEPDRPQNRLNDGKIGPDGCFWVGSMDDRPQKAPVGGLHRVTPDGRSTRVLDGLLISNGLAWSADGRTMFHADSRGPYVQTFAFDPATGLLSNQRELRRLSDAEGRPDGGACDMDGYYWSAGVSAGCLNRIAPDGSIERRIDLPVVAPTMPCFGGEDMRTLFVTSLATDRTGTRQEGTLIAFEVEVPGVPVRRFGEAGPA